MWVHGANGYRVEILWHHRKISRSSRKKSISSEAYMPRDLYTIKNLCVFRYVSLFGDLSDALFVGIFFASGFFGPYPGHAINDKKNQRNNNGYR